MGFLYRKLVRRLLFGMNPELAHNTAIRTASVLQGFKLANLITELLSKAKQFPVAAAGLKFKNPIGLAAGFDKDCEVPKFISRLGFGFLELGTVTLRPQNGNPKPRLFRISEKKALINRMGFNNVGAYQAARSLERLLPLDIPIGINIGKNADCSLALAPKNYLEALKILYPYGDYFAVNISSPNTLQLRELHQKEKLERLLDPLLEFASGQKTKKPFFIKISPDLEAAELESVVSTAVARGFGLIAANTTIKREGLPLRWQSREGGLSGKPLKALADETLKKTAILAAGRVPIIGVGGVFDGRSAVEKLRLGADLVQIYSGLVYEGPFLVKEILEYMDKTGYRGAA
ncbi:MAG: quinone-dependent dihydroorotate dehydrogenase [Elusimicrobia bacterium]|nr:quinone-dependent dihydroorotate dehydrogenase [Elusimicrobiota bacterium]